MLEVEGKHLVVDLSNEYDYFEQRKWMIIDEYLQDLLKLDVDEVIEDEEGYNLLMGKVMDALK